MPSLRKHILISPENICDFKKYIKLVSNTPDDFLAEQRNDVSRYVTIATRNILHGEGSDVLM